MHNKGMNKAEIHSVNPFILQNEERQIQFQSQIAAYLLVQDNTRGKGEVILVAINRTSVPRLLRHQYWCSKLVGIVSSHNPYIDNFLVFPWQQHTRRLDFDELLLIDCFPSHMHTCLP